VAEEAPATRIDKAFGRQAFGADAANYDAARPDYPDWVYETLATRCGVGQGTRCFEIGPATGLATRHLLAMGAQVTAIEPDARLAAFLTAQGGAVEVRNSTFEDAALEDGAYDVGLAATSFHWLDEDQALAKIAKALKPDGWWAAVWNIFGDPTRPDPFHDATTGVLGGVESPSSGVRTQLTGLGFGGEVELRQAALARAGAFEPADVRFGHWPLVLDPDQTVALYATYSNVQVRPDRDAVLAELRRIAETEFAGRVTRHMTTVLYTARRR
jgi:SAM-dependent methyltransferase